MTLRRTAERMTRATSSEGPPGMRWALSCGFVTLALLAVLISSGAAPARAQVHGRAHVRGGAHVHGGVHRHGGAHVYGGFGFPAYPYPYSYGYPYPYRYPYGYPELYPYAPYSYYYPSPPYAGAAEVLPPGWVAGHWAWRRDAWGRRVRVWVPPHLR